MLDSARPSQFEYIKHLLTAPLQALEILLLEGNVNQVNYHLRNRATDLTLPKQKREFLKGNFKFSGAMLWDQLSNPFLKIVKLCFLSVIVNGDNVYAGNGLTPWCRLFTTPPAPPFPHFSHIHESQLSQPFTFYCQKGRVSQ